MNTSTRRLCLALALATSLGTATAQDDFPTTVLADSPEFYYQFEEPAGATSTADTSPNANGSTGITNVTFGEPGAVGLAARFDGTASLVTGSTLNPPGDFTMEIVFSPTSLGGTQVLMSQKDSGGTGRSNFIVSPSGVLNSFVGGGTTNSFATLQPGAWYHGVIAYDADETTLRFYVNGIDFTDEFAPFRNFESNGGNWVIGAHKNQTSQWTTGLIDEAALYGFRLDDPDGDGDTTDSRIAAHWDALTSAGPVALFLDASEPTILEGGSTTLSWQTWGAATVTLDDGSGPVDVTASADEFGVALMDVSPPATTTYTLTASRPGSTAATLQRTVTVNTAPLVNTFNASPSLLVGAGDVTLTWDVANANTVTIDNGVNTGGTTSGTTTLNVTTTTTFTLTATNDNGALNRSLTVTVKNPGDPLTYPESVLASNPVAFYRFEEPAGATAITDTAGGDNNSLDIAATTLGSPGALGTAARFDGTGSVLLDFNLDPGLSDFTIELIARTDQVGVPTQHFLSQQDGTGTGRSIFYLLPSANLTTYLGVGDTQGDTPLLPASWCHIAMVYNTLDATVQFYIDGQPAGTDFTPIPELADGNWVLGAHKSRTSAFLTGSVDELAIYDRTLDATEIASHAEALLADPDAIMLRSFRTDPVYLFTSLGDSATLSWKTTNSDTLAITDDQGGSPVDALPLTTAGAGSIAVSPATTTTYTLTANRAGRPEESADVTVVVDPDPVIDTFTASTLSVLPGQAVTLSWTTTLADTVEVTNTSGGPFLPDESTVVFPTETTTYTLTATNAATSASLGLTVVVRDPAAPQLLAFWPFDGSPSEICNNTPTTLVNPGNAIDFGTSVPTEIAARRSRSLSFGFSNNSDYVATEFTGVAGTTARSVSFWADIDFGDGITTRNLFSYGQDANGGAFVLNANPNDVLQLSYRGGAGNSQVPTAFTPVAFGWSHICVVWHGQSGDIADNSEIYIDGFPVSNQISNTPINSVPTPFNIGFNSVWGTGDFAYDTSISELAFYQGELTPAQITALAGGLDPQSIGKSTDTSPLTITAVGYDTALQEVTLTFTSTPGTRYAVEVSPNLNTGSWNQIDTVTADADTTSTSFFSFGTRNYVRVVTLP